MSEIKLLPCPFCGREAYINYESMVDERRIFWAQIICKHCHSRSNGNWSNSYANAAEKEAKLWNNRKPMERIVKRIDEEIAKADRINKVLMDSGCFKGADIQASRMSQAIKDKQIVKEEGGTSEVQRL